MLMSLSYRLTLINTVDGVSPKDAHRAATFLSTAPPHPFGEGRAVDVLYTPDAPTDAMALATAVRDLWGDHPTPFDLCVQDAAAPRQKRLLLSDMDATIVAEESLDVLADYAGCGNAVATITARENASSVRSSPQRATSSTSSAWWVSMMTVGMREARRK